MGRERGDLIKFNKIINELEKKELVNGINFACSSFSLRAYKLKLRRELVLNCCPSNNFLTNRVVNDWNDLSEVAFKAKKLNIFKAGLHDWMKSSC